MRARQRRGVLTTRGDWAYLWHVACELGDRALYALVVKTLLFACCVDADGVLVDVDGEQLPQVPEELAEHADEMGTYRDGLGFLDEGVRAGCCANACGGDRGAPISPPSGHGPGRAGVALI